MLTAPCELTLPPAFAGRRLERASEVLGVAQAEAAAEGAGRLLWAVEAGRVAFAVTLEPEEPLETARRAIFAGMTALAQALAGQAEPERTVAVAWPDELSYDAARIGGGTLLWPEDCAEVETPAWLVFGAEVTGDRDAIDDPGRFAGSTSLAEEALGPATDLIEAFASYLMLGFDDWAARGFDGLARRYLERMPSGPARQIAPNGDLIEGATRRALVPALAARAWFDPDRGGVRL